MSRRLLPLCALLVLLVPIPAWAGEYEGDERVGDVEGFTFAPEPPPCGTVTDVRPADPRVIDITRLAVRHDADLIDLTLQVRELPNLRRTSVTFALRTPDRAFTVELFRNRRRDELMVSVEKPPPAPPPGQKCFSFLGEVAVRPCRTAVAELDATSNAALVSLPRRCIGSPRWIRVGADIGTFLHGVVYSDTWAPRGSKPSGPWGHVYGPRVRASR